MRIVSSVIIVLALASPARLARAGDQGAEGPAFYELHVWAWRDNPSGVFVDWNPRVSCEGQ